MSDSGLVYLDRSLRRLTPAEWRRLSRDPHYVLVRRTEGIAWVVETTWLGVAASWENPARVFVTVRKLRHGGGKESWHWNATAADAVCCHETLEKEVA